MRYELCLDNRNEPKWSVVLNSADQVGATLIVYAAMFVEDIGEHGNELDAWVGRPGQVGVRKDVASFFAAERLRLRNGHAKNLWRIVHLDSRVRCVTDTYRDTQQAAYVQKVLDVVNRVRVDGQPMAVFLDPCNAESSPVFLPCL